jgi:hypothetical protein
MSKSIKMPLFIAVDAENSDFCGEDCPFLRGGFCSYFQLSLTHDENVYSYLRRSKCVTLTCYLEEEKKEKA